MEFLKDLKIASQNKGLSTGSTWLAGKGPLIESVSPVNGKLIASVESADSHGYEEVVKKAESAFLQWRQWPAPRRGEVVRQIGESLREHKDSLGRLVSYEMGKSLQEG